MPLGLFHAASARSCKRLKRTKTALRHHRVPPHDSLCKRICVWAYRIHLGAQLWLFRIDQAHAELPEQTAETGYVRMHTSCMLLFAVFRQWLFPYAHGRLFGAYAQFSVFLMPAVLCIFYGFGEHQGQPYT